MNRMIEIQNRSKEYLMLKQQFQRLNQFNKNHRRFVKPQSFDENRFSLKTRYIDEEEEKKVNRAFKSKYSGDLRDAHAEVARQNNISNKIILIIASILMLLVWLILR